jgi:hypothetical protein
VSKSKSRITVIDLRKYNVQSIASVLFGFGVYCLLVQMGYGFESVLVTNAFKYIERL